MVSLAKTKLNSIEVLISKALTDSNISHVEFDLVNVLKEYIKILKENQNSSSKISLLIKQYYLTV